jgi:hypothetical protein
MKRARSGYGGYDFGDGSRMGREGRFWGALIGAGASLLGGALSANAADDVANAQSSASAGDLRLAQDQFDYVTAMNQPVINARDSALNAALGLAGLPQSTPGAVPGPSGNPLAANAQGYDWNAYMEANPDVLREYYRAQGASPPANASTPDGLNQFSASHQLSNALFGKKEGAKVNPEWVGRSPEDFAKYHYQTWGQFEGRQVPTLQASQPQQPAAAAPGAPAPGRPAPTSIEQQLQASPGYQFRLNEGNRGLDAAFANTGALGSGARAKAAIKYNQDYASNEYDRQFARVMNLVAPGSQAVNSNQQAGSSYANMVSGANQNRANADAWSSAYRNNAWGNAISDAAGALGEVDWAKVFKTGKAA